MWNKKGDIEFQHVSSSPEINQMNPFYQTVALVREDSESGKYINSYITAET